MKIKLWTLHFKTRNWYERTEVHTSRSEALKSAAELADDDDKDEILDLIAKGRLDEADERLADSTDSSGHDWSIDGHVVDVSKAEQVP